MIDIFKGKAEVFFGKINNWGTFTDKVFLNIRYGIIATQNIAYL
jgi:hypothetical protein